MKAVAGKDATAALQAAAALHREGRLAEALAAYGALAVEHPDNAEVWRLKGSAEHGAGQLERAAESLARALALGGERPPALLAAGFVQQDLGERVAAEALFLRAIAASPRWAPAHLALGVVRMDAGRIEAAAESFRAATEAEPANARAWNNLATALLRGGRRAEGLASLRRSLEIADGAQGRFALGRALVEGGELGAATVEFRRSVELEPGLAYAWLHLATALLHQARHAEALECYDRAVALNPPDVAQIESARLLAMQYGALHTREEIYAAHRAWGVRHAGPEVPRTRSFANDRDRGRRLRVAYLSPRFHRSSAAFLSVPVITRHDPERYEIYCYAEQEGKDEVTERLLASGVQWRKTWGVGDAEVVARMIEDRIDIAVDLAGHSPGHRLGVLARRPAPISMSWLDSFNTTGLDEVDCFVTDERHSPFGDDQPFSERLLRMPRLRYAYEPPTGLPPVRPVPSLAGKAGVAFGSFNRMAKMSRPVLEAWGAILAQVPGSRLLIKNASLDNPVEHAAFRERFVAFGVAPDRVELRGSSSHERMLEEYADIDIALDTFPHNGGITTFEALLMGRPVVALRGDVLLARQSSALLEIISRPGLVADTAAGYAETARALAVDPVRLAAAAGGMREALLASAAVDVPRFTRDWEHALRDAWAQWCAKGATR